MYKSMFFHPVHAMYKSFWICLWILRIDVVIIGAKPQTITLGARSNQIESEEIRMDRNLRMRLYQREHGSNSIAGTCMEITLYDSMSIDGSRHSYFWGLTNTATGHRWFCPLSGEDVFIRLSCQLVNRGYTQRIGRMVQEYPSANFVQRITFRLDDSLSDYQRYLMKLHTTD